uniref:Uncharacterized protein n=1 Tax=Anguilla anguilla TaxID=7936 RepID=A0A0E9VMG2_ANGAN
MIPKSFGLLFYGQLSQNMELVGWHGSNYAWHKTIQHFTIRISYSTNSRTWWW